MKAMETRAVKGCLALGTGFCRPFWGMDLRLFKREQLSGVSCSQGFSCHAGPTPLIQKSVAGEGPFVGAYIVFLLHANNC